MLRPCTPKLYEILNEINGEQALLAVGTSVENFLTLNYINSPSTGTKMVRRGRWILMMLRKYSFVRARSLSQTDCHAVIFLLLLSEWVDYTPRMHFRKVDHKHWKRTEIVYSKPLPVVDSVNKRHAKLFIESNHHDQIAAQTETGTKKGLKRIRKSTKIAQDNFAKETEKGLDEEETEKDLEGEEAAKNNEEYNIKDPKKIQSKGAPKGGKQRCSKCNGLGHKAPKCTMFPNQTQ